MESSQPLPPVAKCHSLHQNLGTKLVTHLHMLGCYYSPGYCCQCFPLRYPDRCQSYDCAIDLLHGALPTRCLYSLSKPEREAMEHPFLGSSAAQAALDKLKQHFTTAPTLIQPDLGKEFIVKVDISDSGVGAVLSQQHSGKMHACAFFSHRLTPAKEKL